MTKTVSDPYLQDPRFVLMDDSLQVRHTLKDVGYEDAGYGFLLVHAEDGDYVEVWGGTGVAFLTKEAHKIYPEE